jgi:Tfp pilus assembly protein PilF
MFNKKSIPPEKQKLIIYIFLTLAILAVFWQVNQYDFISLDDYAYVAENNHIQSGITMEGFHWAFSTTHAEFWHPLTWLSFMLDYELHGLNPAGYHLTNLILHILSTLLLFWLFCRMTGAVWKSAFVAALFALHPLHVESVAWISERKDVLSAFFWMLTLCLYVYYTEKPVIRRYLLVVFSFVLALMSKPMVVTLPVIMILLDYWPLNRFESKKDNLILWQLKEKLPFFILSAVLAIITLHNPNNTDVSAKVFPLSSRIANAPVSFMIYLEKTFWPHDLSVYYPFSDQLPIWQVMSSILLIFVISYFVIAMMKRLPYLFFGWFWYMITLLPVLGIIQISLYSMADHYHYLPSIGLAVMLVWGIPSLIKSKKKILFPLGLSFILIMAFITWKQCGYWKNSIELLNHTLEVTKGNYLMHLNRGAAYDDLGQYNLSIEDYNEAIRLKPDYAEAYYNRGCVYAKLGQYKLTIENCNVSIRLKPDYIEAYFNRGSAYAELGQYKNAIDDFDKTVILQPDYLPAYLNRGYAYAKLGQYQRAIENYDEAIRLQSDYAPAYIRRADLYFNRGDKEKGCFDAHTACASGSCGMLEKAKSKGYCR